MGDAPSLSNWLLHFTVRGGESLQRPDVTARSRLEQIIRDERIDGNVTHWSLRQRAAVCVAECREEDLTYLVRQRGWQPWAVAFRLSTIDAAGGAPAWYVRTEQWERIRDDDSQLAAEISDWVVRWDIRPGRRSDWRHEREWRIPGDYLDLRLAPPVAFIVGDPDWFPPPLPDPNLGRGDQLEHWTEPPQWARVLPRIWWNPEDGRVRRFDPPG